MDCNDRITTSIGWREHDPEQCSKLYETSFGPMCGFVWRRSTGEYSATLYEDSDDENGLKFSDRLFADHDTAKKWLDVVVSEWGRLFEMKDHEIEKEWMEKVRESS